MPVHLGAMPMSVESALDELGPLEAGDVVCLNDPFRGGTHLPDITLISPVHDPDRGTPLGYVASRAHHSDVGGMSPGSMPLAQEIYQEGLQLPPLKLYARGKLNREIIDIILHNVRVPRERQGDILAQITGLKLGEKRLEALLDRYGQETVFASIAELERRSERAMRGCIGQIPDGVYTFEEHIDSDGVVWEPLRIYLQMTIEGSGVHIDFSGSSPPCRGPLNSVLSTTMAGVYIAFKHTFPDVPINAGCFRPFTYNVPESTFLNAKHPRPVSGCAAEVCQRIIDVVLGALGKAIPGRAYAGPMGTVTNLAVGGEDPERGPFVFYSFIGGGYGGNYLTDGLTNGNPTIALARTQALEIFESRYPVRFVRYALREGSAGAGQRRGGFGVVLEFELCRGEASASILGDRGRFAPFGFDGGKPGMMARHTFYLNGEDYRPPHITKDEGVCLKKGDVLKLETPGGGGFGDPSRRDPKQVQEDVRRGYLTRESARKDYGVSITDQGLIDEEETTKLRVQPSE